MALKSPIMTQRNHAKLSGRQQPKSIAASVNCCICCSQYRIFYHSESNSTLILSNSVCLKVIQHSHKFNQAQMILCTPSNCTVKISLCTASNIC